MTILREYIRYMIQNLLWESRAKDNDKKNSKSDNEDLLVEPDLSEEGERSGEEADEMSTVGAGGGSVASSGQISGVISHGASSSKKSKKKSKKKSSPYYTWNKK